MPAAQRDPGDVGPPPEGRTVSLGKSACGRTGSEGRRGTEHPRNTECLGSPRERRFGHDPALRKVEGLWQAPVFLKKKGFS